MTRLLLLAALALSAGCETSWGAPGLEITPLVDEGATMEPVAWDAHVGAAAAAWNEALGARGCDPAFVMAENGRPIRLVSATAWRWGAATAGITHYDPDEIEIRVIPDLPGGHPAYERYLLHELGHALGLGHTDGGIMDPHPRVEHLTDADVAAAAEYLGCAP